MWKSAENKMKFVFAQNQEVESVFSLFPVWKSVKKITTKRVTQNQEVFIWYQCESLQKIKWNLVFAQNQDVESVFSLFPVRKSVKKITRKKIHNIKKYLFGISVKVCRKEDEI